MSNLFDDVEAERQEFERRLIEKEQERFVDCASTKVILTWFEKEAGVLIEAKRKELKLTQELVGHEGKEARIVQKMLDTITEIEGKFNLKGATSNNINGNLMTRGTFNPSMTKYTVDEAEAIRTQLGLGTAMSGKIVTK